MANESGMSTNHAEFQREKVDNLLYLKHNATKRIKLFHIKPWMPTICFPRFGFGINSGLE